MEGFCDLNVLESSSFVENLANVKQLIFLGYSCVALNRLHPPPEHEGKKKNCSAAEHVKSMQQLLKNLTEAIKVIEESPNEELVVPKNFKLLSRLTIQVENVSQLGLLRNNYFKQLSNAFDLIALIPENEMVYKSLMEGKIEFDIINIRLDGKLPFKPSRESMGLGVAKEYVFEVCYSQSIKSVSLRKYIFSNGKSFVQKTKKGRGIIFSSGGSCWIDFRSPYDVVNLANLFDLEGSSCHEVVKLNCQKVISHSILRRKTFKGLVSVEKTNATNDDNEPSSKRLKTDISQ